MADYTDRKEWDRRYSKPGNQPPGTRDHTEAGNAQFYRAKYDALDRCLVEIKDDLMGKTILDCAGGTGQFIPYFLERGSSHVTIADYSLVAVQAVRQRWKDNERVSAVEMDLTTYLPDLGNSPRDIVLVQEAIFLLPEDSAFENAITNLTRYVKPGGYLIISDLFPDVRTARTYVVRRPRALFEHLLKAANFEIIGYVRQTVFFNRRVFGLAQLLIEQIGSLFYWLDRVARVAGMRAPAELDIKYLIARNTPNDAM